MDSTSISTADILQQLAKSKAVCEKLVQLKPEEINQILLELADLTISKTSFLLAENQKDLDRMDTENPKYDRLLLSESRLVQIAEDLRKVASFPSPLGHIMEDRMLENGIHLQKVSAPIGVIGLVFESRPNVTFDVFALCFKSGNVAVLKGSRDAHYSNLAILQLIHQVLATHDLEAACYLAPSERAALGTILSASEYIDLLIPRGGQGLIDYVRKNASMPVVETGAGVVHTYFAESANLEKGKAVLSNAKSRRVSVCNALDTILIHRTRIEALPFLLSDLGEKHECKVWADPEAYAVLQGEYPDHLLLKANEEDFGKEFLSMQLSIKTLANLEEAIAHIQKHSSKHSEAILSEDAKEISAFMNRVDAAVVYANASTAFTDGGQFGLGAEIGISTQKLHARGPMGLRELTSYKWLAYGDGQVRS